MPQSALTITNSLTGTASPLYAVTHTTVGVAAVNHTNRAALAKNVLNNPQGYAALFAQAIAANTQAGTDYVSTNPPAAANVTDADINNAVSAVWNCYA